MAADHEEGPSVWAAIPRAAHSAHAPRMPWSHPCRAREESAGGPGDTARGVVELAASREGALAASLRPLVNVAKSYGDDCSSPRRGQDREVRAPARDDVPDLWSTRVRSEGRRPRVSRSLRPRCSARRPLVTCRSFSSRRLAQRSGRAPRRIETTGDAHGKGNAKGLDREPCRRRQLAKADSCRRETGHSGQAAGVRGRPQRPKTAGQIEIGMLAQRAFVTVNAEFIQVKVVGLCSFR